MKNIKVLIIGIVCVTLVVGYYMYLSSRNTDDQPSGVDKRVEVVKIIEDTDLTKDYPKTPRSVVKLYNRILMSYYNEEYTDKQFLKIGDLQRGLLDEELLKNNERDAYFNNLRAEIKNYKENERTITSATVSSTSDVIYKIVDKRECAYVTSSYFIKEKSSYEKTLQRYVLRKDEEGKWKILVFYLIEGDSKDD